MAKPPKHSVVAAELKKEYLREHLEEIKTLIRDWMSELHHPEPFAPKDRSWGWQSAFRPPRIDIPDDNHRLRRHLRSRALWSHVGNWDRSLEEIWEMTRNLRLEAGSKIKKQPVTNRWNYTGDYAAAALWKAFDAALGKTPPLTYTTPTDAPGVQCGAFRIEGSASNPEELRLVEREHVALIGWLQRSAAMKRLVSSWAEAQDLETKVAALADTALKSSDILYACKFCRHLWQ